MKWLYDRLEKAPFNQLVEKSGQWANLTTIQTASLILSYLLDKKHDQPLFLVEESMASVHRLVNQLSDLAPHLRVAFFDMDDPFRVDYIASSFEKKTQQLSTLYDLIHNPPHLLVTTGSSLLVKLPPKELFQAKEIHLSINDEWEIQDLITALQGLGYQRETLVSSSLSFAPRGGLVDVFSIQYDHPIRIEFFDNIIESIRFFDMESQTSIQEIDNVTIFPASLYLLDDQQKKALNDLKDPLLDLDKVSLLTGASSPNLYPLFSLVAEKKGLLDWVDTWPILLSNKEAIKESMDFQEKENGDFLKELIVDKKWIPQAHGLWFNPSDLDFSRAMVIHQYDHLQEGSHLPISIIDNPHLELEAMVDYLLSLALTASVVVVLKNHQIDQIKDLVDIRQAPYNDLVGQPQKGLQFYVGTIDQGFVLDQTTYVFGHNEVYNTRYIKGRFQHTFAQSIQLSGIADLCPGDYVVHRSYGIGRYQGLQTKEIDNHLKDFLEIEYANQDQLLIPLDQFNSIRKYTNKEAVGIKLNKLGSSAWKKTKDKIKASMLEIADQLVEIYQERSQKAGFAFSPDDATSLAFEQDFPFELTLDQKQAVQELKEDMEKPSPMDRLLCGDVGFGKTEVATIGAFKAVKDNKQVAFLCPTTILSNQHYETFVKRFKNFPVKIGLLNRFVSPKDQEEVLKQVKNHQIDILIGTHRLLSKDVEFNDLGFLIIDEEQRFGVLQKEKIKKLKANIDVLSLSATPIPRTLQMSLAGLRSFSQITTPPQDRLPVMTYVVERSDKLVDNLIAKELGRSGQVFYLYNRTLSIYGVANRLAKRFPHSQVGVVHGQMGKEEIEETMTRFINNDLQILVCTTIVETGLDIPNANTMIIENADQLGLAQLYQIKGRVGRSDRLAYCYFMVEPKKQLSEIAKKRLDTLKEFTALGSGYKIAMRDLTIRGAGQLLGGQQSGFIDAVGIDLYMDLLKEALSLRKEKDQEKPLSIETEGYVPKAYTSNDGLKIDFYQDLDNIDSLEDLWSYQKVVEDRYGRMSNDIKAVFEKQALVIFQKEGLVETYREDRKKVEVILTEEKSRLVDGQALFIHISKDVRLRYLNERIHLIFPKTSGYQSELVENLTLVRKMVSHAD